MKKQKPSERSSAGFSNDPFKSLKSIKQKVSPASAPAKPKPAPVQKEKQEDAEELFLRSVAGARPIDPDAAKAEAPERGQPRPGRVSDDRNEQELFLHAMQKIGATFREPKPEPDKDEPPVRSSSSRMKQLKRGTIAIRGELDLHGYLREEALARLEQFITQAYQRGQKAVLIITGKGINSPEGPVLQGAVSDWLQRKGKGMVAEFGPAPRDKGGSGAFVVFLKNK